MRRVPAVGIVLLSLWFVEPTTAQSSSVASATVRESAGDPAFQGFNQAVERYLDLRKRLQHEVPPPRVTPNVAEIKSRSDGLALALQRARPKARQGDFFDTAASRAIVKCFDTALAGVDISRFLAHISDEPADNRPPRIHMRYPVTGSMTTMPPDILALLPELPTELEYRLNGRHLILRDVDGALILDYSPNAVRLRTTANIRR